MTLLTCPRCHESAERAAFRPAHMRRARCCPSCGFEGPPSRFRSPHGRPPAERQRFGRAPENVEPDDASPAFNAISARLDRVEAVVRTGTLALVAAAAALAVAAALRLAG